VLWSPAGRSDATRRRAAGAGLVPVRSLEELLAESAIVLSICPPAAAENVGVTVAEAGYAGVFVEANAVSPVRAAAIAQGIVRAGGDALDGAVIGPPPSSSVGARLYLSGPEEPIAAVAAVFAGTAVEVRPVDGTIGSASAVKMAFAGYQKATRTLAALAHALADRHGVTQHLLAEARSMAGLPLAERDYLPSVAARAWRWAPELREVADTLSASGLPAELAQAASEVLLRWDDQRDRWDLPVEDVLDCLVVPEPTGTRG
jgi:3-hydroxyisobutyrate dehydrogenase-like beta-hydroxyacid dehydrogenase